VSPWITLGRGFRSWPAEKPLPVGRTLRRRKSEGYFMQSKRTVDEYIEKQPEWGPALRELRKIALSSGLEETIKWGAPVYTEDGKNVVGLGAFKSYVGLWFFQGALLKDAKKKLISAQGNKTKALRQWRFDTLKAIRAEKHSIRAYLKEAIDNQRQGKSIKPERNKPLVIPEELAVQLSRRSKLNARFNTLSKAKQREYAEYIGEAKRQETKRKRLAKITPMILAGIGLNDKY
jgi:uncharacterized protein YdeI (YjbR/CyaY-like superfamily)